ncbi:MAG: hypothetical protein WC449_02235 [Candidatus Paceibacterota bacterium]
MGVIKDREIVSTVAEFFAPQRIADLPELEGRSVVLFWDGDAHTSHVRYASLHKPCILSFNSIFGEKQWLFAQLGACPRTSVNGALVAFLLADEDKKNVGQAISAKGEMLRHSVFWVKSDCPPEIISVWSRDIKRFDWGKIETIINNLNENVILNQEGSDPFYNFPSEQVNDLCLALEEAFLHGEAPQD